MAMSEVSYAGLPARLRRIVKVYDYCVADVSSTSFGDFQVTLKEGYSHRDGSRLFIYLKNKQTDELIYFFKNIVRPSVTIFQIALYGFRCPACGTYISRGSNYQEVQGLNICARCVDTP